MLPVRRPNREGGDEKHYQYPYAEQALVEQSIRNGNAEIAIHSVERVLDKIERMEQSLIIQKCLHFDIINLVVKIAASLGQPLSGAEVTQLSSWENSRSLRAARTGRPGAARQQSHPSGPWCGCR